MLPRPRVLAGGWHRAGHWDDGLDYAVMSWGPLIEIASHKSDSRGFETAKPGRLLAVSRLDKGGTEPLSPDEKLRAANSPAILSLGAIPTLQPTIKEQRLS